MIPANLTATCRPLLAGLVITALLGACAKLPERGNAPEGRAEATAGEGLLAELAAATNARFAEPDAAMLIPGAQQALELRLALIDSATVSLDAQYFVWYGGAAGDLMLQRVLLAADRGVKVRLLVDDLNLLSDSSLDGPDVGLAALDSHPNVQLRVFNPGQYRSGTMGIAGSFAGDFSQFNRRMHNKLFIADGHLAIIGGRNIANEYFGLKSDYNFLDLDALFSGEVLPSMQEAFDLYWNAEAAHPAAGLSPDTGVAELDIMRDELDEALAAETEILASFPLKPRDWSVLLDRALQRMVGVNATFLQDNPAIDGDDSYRLGDMLAEFDTDEDREVIIVSPYLIPLEGALEDLRADIDKGVKVTLLTASLASGDHTAVNAHYKKYRRGIIEAGAELYEFHHQPGEELRAMADTAPVRGEFVALHPKAGVTDRKSCFVGSLNLDPRALVANTENGMVVDSDAFCGELADLLETYLLPENSWHVTLDEQGNLQWTSYEGTVNEQPARSSGQRWADFFFRIMPIEDLL